MRDLHRTDTPIPLERRRLLSDYLHEQYTVAGMRDSLRHACATLLMDRRSPTAEEPSADRHPVGLPVRLSA